MNLPDYYVQHHLQSGALITLLDNNRVQDEGIWAVYPQNRHLLPKTRLQVDYLAEKLV